MMHDTGITSEPAELAALAVDGPQPVWMTLDAARERAFTGEIVFETDPEVCAYLDNGIVYYAERATDLSLGHRLVGAGVLDAVQLECGTVRVGDIEHLGRLFDRDPSVDRDAVIVLAETTTQDLIAEVANRSIAAARITAYRHHPSGVHRWFVAPSDPAAVARGVGAVGQLDATVLDELPSLSFDEADVAELVIEWDDEIDDLPERYTDAFGLTSALVGFDDAGIDSNARERARADAEAHAFADAGVEADADEEADVFADLFGPIDVEPVVEVDDSQAVESVRRGIDFAVLWPGSFEVPTTGGAPIVERSTTSVEETSDDGGLRFTMPPLDLSDQRDETEADVPNDVAEAVRRAIAAIESAGIDALESQSGPEPVMLDAGTAPGADLAEGAGPAPTLPAPGGLGAFAPPTMATHADVLYAQMEAGGSMDDASADVDEGRPSRGTSMTFVDDPAERGADIGTERSSALRRLIGSLRRKDQ